MHNKFSAILVTASSFLIVTEVHADESVPVLANSHNNLRYGQYEIIEDHPECNARDEIAFNVPFRIDELDYVITDPANETVIFESDQLFRECTLTTTRGTERVVTKIPCSDGANSDSGNQLKNLGLSVKLEGEIRVCRSPRNDRVLAKSWALSGTSEAEIEGNPASVSVSSETIRKAADLDEDLTARVFVDYFSGSNRTVSWEKSSRKHDLAQALNFNSYIWVNVSCIPINSNLPDPSFIEFQARFMLVNGPEQTCTAADCPVPLSDMFMGYLYSTNPSTGEAIPNLTHKGTGQHCLRQ
ncbi:MAG: hypothetical protein ABJH45_16165 [Paracoccaceae bacterium]